MCMHVCIHACYMHVHNFDSSYMHSYRQLAGAGKSIQYCLCISEREREREREGERPTVGQVPWLVRTGSEVMKDRPCHLVS